LKKPLILCVDDDKLILDSLRKQLKNKFGNKYYYEFAENGADAMELIDELMEDNYNVLTIVSDWLMPGMRGDELLVKIHRKFPKIVTVMLTGQADKNAIQNAIQNANLHRCIYKPWTEEELVSAITTGIKES
jgi:CheY-like chemotaxis protein